MGPIRVLFRPLRALRLALALALVLTLVEAAGLGSTLGPLFPHADAATYRERALSVLSRGGAASSSSSSSAAAASAAALLSVDTTANRTSFYITVRDGVQLWTVISVPTLAPGATVSTVLYRTPYTTDNWAPNAAVWNERGFAFVMQDQRGSGQSRGDEGAPVAWTYWRADGQDNYDAMAWIVAQPWSDGTVHLQGGSADGIPIYTASLLEPPWLGAVFPIVASGNLHRTTYQGGAFRTALIGWWLALQGFAAAADEVLQHEARDAWWDPITLTGREHQCHGPGVHYGGWFDIFADGTVDAFELLQYSAPDARCRGQQYLVMEPGGHCVQGDYPWPSPKSAIADNIATYLFLRESGMEIPESLRTRVESTGPITFYVMGPANSTDGNFWTTLDAWPPSTPQVLYLTPERILTTEAPTNASLPPFVYEFDPADPVRTKGGPELLWPCGPREQSRRMLDRPDVLLFTGYPFWSATGIVGHVTATLYVSTNRNDTDFTVKLMDVYEGPLGPSYLMQDGIARLRWRNGPSVAEPAVPGFVYKIEIDLWRTAYVMERGHKLGIAVSSSNYPRFSVNPNSGLPIAEADAGPQLVAENRIYIDATRPSHITVPIVAMRDLPRNFTP